MRLKIAQRVERATEFSRFFQTKMSKNLVPYGAAKSFEKVSITAAEAHSMAGELKFTEGPNGGMTMTGPEKLMQWLHQLAESRQQTIAEMVTEKAVQQLARLDRAKQKSRFYWFFRPSDPTHVISLCQGHRYLAGRGWRLGTGSLSALKPPVKCCSCSGPATIRRMRKAPFWFPEEVE